MNRLKSLTQTPPGGWRYRQPETGWRLEPNFGTFDHCVAIIQRHRMANAKLGLPLEQEAVAESLEQYMVAELNQSPEHVWMVGGGAPPPKSTPPPGPRRAGAVKLRE